MKCVVIGGSGFVGTRLIKELRPEWDVVNLDISESNDFGPITHLMDVRDLNSFKHYMKGADVVVLLAAEHKDDVTPASLYHDVNVIGIKNVLAAMDIYGVRKIVFTSTIAIYGMDISTPLHETDLIEPFNDYGQSKWQAEQYLQDWVGQDITKYALVLRPSVIFGETNRGNLYNLLNQIYNGKFLMIGNGLNKKSMSYVGNVVNFISQQLSNLSPGIEIYNYADKPDFEMDTLVTQAYLFRGQSTPRLRIPYSFGVFIGYTFDFIAKLTRKKFPVSLIRIKKFCSNSLVDTSKLDDTKFVRPYDLLEALQNTIIADFTLPNQKFQRGRSVQKSVPKLSESKVD